jgi:hypothetical protein
VDLIFHFALDSFRIVDITVVSWRIWFPPSKWVFGSETRWILCSNSCGSKAVLVRWKLMVHVVPLFCFLCSLFWREFCLSRSPSAATWWSYNIRQGTFLLIQVVTSLVLTINFLSCNM